SKLVDAADLGVAASPHGSSISGRSITQANLTALMATRNEIEISIDGSRYVPVNLGASGAPAGIQTAINNEFILQGLAPIAVNVTAAAGLPALGNRLQFESAGPGDVFIRPAPSTADLAVPMMLGTAQGGIETSVHAVRRPAPTGLTSRVTTL